MPLFSSGRLVDGDDDDDDDDDDDETNGGTCDIMVFRLALLNGPTSNA